MLRAVSLLLAAQLTLFASQAQFVTAEQPNALFSGGFGAGKSWALVMRALRLSAKYPAALFGFAGPTYTALRKDCIEPLRRLTREMGWDSQLNRQDWHFRPDWCRGEDAGLWIVGADRADSIKGPNWHGVFINEPGIIKKDSYEVLVSRSRVPLVSCPECDSGRVERIEQLLTRDDLFDEEDPPLPGDVYETDIPCEVCGCPDARIDQNQISAAGTPEGFNWLYDEFVDKSQHPERDWSEWLHVTASSRDNKYNAAGYVDRMSDSFDPRLAEEKIEGKFVNVTAGRVYYAFDRNVHLAEPYYDPELPLLWSFDFNVSPFCTTVSQRHGDTLWVIDEITSPDGGWTAEIVEEFCQRGVPLGDGTRSPELTYGDHAKGITVFGDASGRNRDTQTKGHRSDWQIVKEQAARFQLRHFQIDVARGNSAVRDGVSAVNARLKSASGKVRLYISRHHCPYLSKDMEQQVYKPGTMLLCEGTGADRGKIGHAADSLRYKVEKLWPLVKSSAGTVRVHA